MKPSTVLREQPKSEALTLIADQLDRLAKLYQIPNWDGINSILLAEWIMDEYPAELMQTVMACLSSAKSEGKTWRLTPDTIREWMGVELDRIAAKREQYIHNKKHEEAQAAAPQEISAETQAMINEYTERLLGGLTKPAPITENDIRREGQRRPVQSQPILPLSEVDVQIRDVAYQYGITIEQVKDIRTEWMLECFDLYTGRPKPNYLSFTEWIIK